MCLDMLKKCLISKDFLHSSFIMYLLSTEDSKRAYRNIIEI